jgi:ATP-dependent DNA helicase RecG
MGTGIKKIRDLIKKAGLKEPVFEYDTFFRVTLYRNPEYALKAGGQKRWVEKVGRKGEQKINIERLARSQKMILKLMAENPGISKRELSIKVGIGATAVDKNIVALKKKGFIKRIGPAKGGYWQIIER